MLPKVDRHGRLVTKPERIGSEKEFLPLLFSQNGAAGPTHVIGAAVLTKDVTKVRETRHEMKNQSIELKQPKLST